MAGDLYFANVSTLLHLNGSNGSTSVVDRAPTPKTWTYTGTAAQSTAQAALGTASSKHAGSGALYTGTDTDFVFGSGDWTIEYQVYAAAAPGSPEGLVIKRSITSGFAPFYNYLNTNGKVHVSVSLNGSTWAVDSDVSTALTMNAWNHVAFVRSGSFILMFLNGTNVLSSNIGAGALMTSGADVVLGAGGSDGGVPFNGYIDEVRFTKGVARYVANFTPPTASFPDGGSFDVTGIAPATVFGTPSMPHIATGLASGTLFGTPNSPYTQTGTDAGGIASTAVGTPALTQRSRVTSLGRITRFGVPGRTIHQAVTNKGSAFSKVGTPTSLHFAPPLTARAVRARGLHSTKFGRPTS